MDRPLIYIVDDSADYRFFVSQVFKRFLTQYRVQYFESGTALCAHLGVEPVELPCLILMDHQMPGLSGPQTLTYLKQHPSWRTVPTIIVSSSTSSEDQQEALQAGAISYLVKPVAFVSLKEQLTQLCEHWSVVCHT
jgi:CheY-like chemotaxis protein